MSYIGNQPVLNTSEFREEFAVTSTQSVFNTGGFTASSDSATLEVLRNGVLLGTVDYTLGSDASTVTLANAAVNGDIIVIKGRRELTNGVQVTERRHEHTMGSGETTVTFPYPLTVSQTDVYLNGVKLGSTDFSINSSTRVVSFTTNPAVGDLVAIVSREPALTANSSLPVVDAAGTNVLSESGGVVTLTADEANVGSNALVVDSSGNVGVGTSPSTKLDISDTSRLTVNVSNAYVLETSLNSAGSAFASHYENASDHIFQTAGTERMRIDSSGALILAGSTAQKATGTAWSNPSDQRLKSNISDYPKGIAELMQVRVREWEYNGKGGTVAGTKGLGVIADEIMTVLPNTVDNYEAKLNVDDEETTQIKKFDATEITWLLVKTTQEQQTIIESQQSQIDALTARIEALEATP
jgi:hypothetical protein